MPTVYFVDPNGERKAYEFLEGETVYEFLRRSDLSFLECSCEGSLACSTCHVLVDPDWYDAVLACNPISQEEDDMLEFAFGLAVNSRLGCQLRVTNELNGLVLRIPAESRNIGDVG